MKICYLVGRGRDTNTRSHILWQLHNLKNTWNTFKVHQICEELRLAGLPRRTSKVKRLKTGFKVPKIQLIQSYSSPCSIGLWHLESITVNKCAQKCGIKTICVILTLISADATQANEPQRRAPPGWRVEWNRPWNWIRLVSVLNKLY